MAKRSSTKSASASVKAGETVYYPGKQGQMCQGTVATLTRNTVLFTDGNWCYIREMRKNKV